MRVLVVTWDGGSNRQPFEVIVAQLIGRGDSVHVLSNEVHREVFEALGATFSSLGVADKELGSRPQLDEQLARVGEVVFSLVTADRVAAALDASVPDVTVVDVVMLSAQAALERAGAPFVSLHHTLTAASWGGSRRGQIEGSVGRVNRMRSDLGLDPVAHYQDVHAIASAHIVPTAAALDAPPPWPVDLSYVGPLQPPGPGRIPADLPPRFVLVSFSTTWQHQVDVLQRVIDALGQLDVPVVVTTGPSVDPSELRPARNSLIYAAVPHHRILDRTDVVVTHAGHGTVISALTTGVPLVCVPQGRDQFDVARQVELTGTGIVVGSGFEPDDLCDSVNVVLDDARYRTASAAMSASIAGHGGVDEAVAIIDMARTSSLRKNQTMIFTSPLPPVRVPTTALTPYILERAAQRGGKTAFVDAATGRTMTYAEFEDAVRRQAGGWLAGGLAKGDVVAVMAPNCPEYGVLFHAVALAGGVITTVNPTYTAGEVHHQLVDAGATRLVTVPMFIETAAAAIAETNVTETYVIGEAAGYPSLSSIDAAPLADQVPVDLDDVVVLPYSSGTTGLSKGVMLTHGNLVANIEQTLAMLSIQEDDGFVAVLPFFHIYGMQVLMNTGLRAGATIVTMPRFDLEQFLSLHQEHQLTCAFVAPPMVVALAKHPVVDNYDLSALRFILSGAAPLSAELAAECAERLGCLVLQGYGMTELSPVSHATPVDRMKAGSAGVTAPNTEVTIVDPATQAALGVGQDGEVWVRGPQVMKGYLNNDVATKSTIDDEGWLHTGDIGHIDGDGHLFIVDRLKELIKYKGFQVPPAELEAVLLTHPQVADAAVIGLPDDDAGEIPAAYVVLKQGQAATAEDIQAFVAEKVASYKQIRKVTFIDAIPKSASGKILRRVLRDQGAH